MHRYTDADIRRDLASLIAEHGLRGAARQLNVSPTMVSLVMKAALPPGPKIASALGYTEDGLRWVRRDGK
jgi:hypothetical protein